MQNTRTEAQAEEKAKAEMLLEQAAAAAQAEQERKEAEAELRAIQAQLEESQAQMEASQASEERATQALIDAVTTASATNMRKTPTLATYKSGEILPMTGKPCLNEPGEWHVMFSYCQHTKAGQKVAANAKHRLEHMGYRIWLDVDMDKKDVAAMREGVQCSMLVVPILCSEGPGDQLGDRRCIGVG